MNKEDIFKARITVLDVINSTEKGQMKNADIWRKVTPTISYANLSIILSTLKSEGFVEKLPITYGNIISYKITPDGKSYLAAAKNGSITAEDPIFTVVDAIRKGKDGIATIVTQEISAVELEKPKTAADLARREKAGSFQAITDINSPSGITER